jgi:hypothetical protein
MWRESRSAGSWGSLPRARLNMGLVPGHATEFDFAAGGWIADDGEGHGRSDSWPGLAWVVKDAPGDVGQATFANNP